MSVYPFSIDDDSTIIRIDDNITELGGQAINQLRDAVFAIESEVGTDPSGSLNSLSDRLNVSLNANGTIKASALTSIGLVTLPISDSQVGTNAAIKEYKLQLDHATSDLYTLILTNKAISDGYGALAVTTSTDFLNHLAGSTYLSDNATSARHVASQIDLNAVATDPRDPFYSWTGLLDKTGTARTATQVAAALLQINNDLVAHENATTGAHVATAVSVDTSNFIEIPASATNLQAALEYLDNAELLNVGEHRAVQHAAGVPPIARIQSVFNPDGYGDTVVPATLVNAYLIHNPAISPTDDNSVGDDIVKFKPTNSNFTFDAQFSQVKVGDVLRINYGNGMETSFPIESIRFVPGADWTVRINGRNLADSVDGYVDGYSGSAYARIDRPLYDENTYGVLAVASANAIPASTYSSTLSSLIVGNPRGATALGLGFDGNQLNSSHYKLWLELYPTGNPNDMVVSLPAIDVTGDAGASPGSYTLEKVVHKTNDAFRSLGYNYRFIAFEHDGNFGIMLADAVNNASFAIVSGKISGSTTPPSLSQSIYTQNVVGDATDGFDPLGFGGASAGLASPAYQSTFSSANAALTPTRVISPVKRRFYIVDGRRLDGFEPTYLANQDGYWPATITARTVTGTTVEITYSVDLDLCSSGMSPGKTIVVQPDVAFSSPDYNSNDYGRFIIKSVVFTAPCGTAGATTTLTVINGVHGTGAAISSTSLPGRKVHLHFSGDSVGFNDLQVSDETSGIDYHRFHEVYVSKEGRTFSHERARLPRQSETSTLLSTDFWHIKDISAKLRGYKDDNLSFDKYIRFYVTRYDSVSGEFDGYIGKRNSSNATISKTGPLTTSRKNVVTRFYDETYNDYVDLTFEELSSGPSGSPIISDSNPHYVDIQLFQTMRTNDEMLLIGLCEVNWSPASGQNIVQGVRSVRATGSVDELDFTESAKNYISAGDRALHENGIVRGYEYVSSGTTTGELFYTGGEALVNGTIVISNDSSVTIPQISAVGVTPATVTWAICVNEYGSLVPIVVTSTKTQFFAQAAQYYVQSVTFEELVSARKDLTLISLVTAHIASITINDSDVSDARRFVGAAGFNHPLVLTSSSKFAGNFHGFPAIKSWVNNYGNSSNLVRVRGNFTISSTVDLTGFTSPVIFEGDGGTITVTSAIGFNVGSNVKFKNIKFIYNPTGLTYTSGNKVNYSNGCLYGNPNTTISNVNIENCEFSCTIGGTQRPPFISFVLGAADVMDTITITRNTFTDTNTVDQAAISFITDSSGTDPAVISDLLISNNVCNNKQGIYVTTTTSSPGTVSRAGLSTINCEISGNSCGAIGYMVSSARSSSTSNKWWNRPNGLRILRNVATFIGTLDHLGFNIGQSTLLPIPYGTGNVLIDGNNANWIQIVTEGVTDEVVSVNITNNVLQAYSNSYLISQFGSTVPAAISVRAGIAQSSVKLQICNNTTDFGMFGGTKYDYQIGVRVSTAATISNNEIRGLADLLDGISTSSIGIYLVTGAQVSSAALTDMEESVVITGNRIYRSDGSTITAYIKSTGSTVPSPGVVTGNVFNSRFITGALDSGSDTNVISGMPASFIVDRNKNQTVTMTILSDVGLTAINDSSGSRLVTAGAVSGSVYIGPTYNGLLASETIVGSSYETVSVKSDSTTRNFVWDIPLASALPYGVSVVSAITTIRSTTKMSSSAVVKFAFINSSLTGSGSFSSPVSYEFGSGGTYSPGADQAFSITAAVGKVIVVPNSTNQRCPRLVVWSSGFGDTAAGWISIDPITITYVY